MIGVLHGAFHVTVEDWAAMEAARTGSIPEVYVSLDSWIDILFRTAYIVHLVAAAGFGWAILRTGIVAPWVGWTVMGWSALWIAGYVVSAGAPGLLFIMPTLIGATLLFR